MYPIKFNNIYFEKVWGGSKLTSFRDNLTSDSIGESWDISCHPNGISIVENGDLKGLSLQDILNQFDDKIIGTDFKGKEFPLLVKIINAEDNLSVQVHPNNEYAAQFDNQKGKSEIWYILDANEDAELILGLNTDSISELEESVRNGNTDKILNRVKVKKGDCFYIPSGMVHAIGKGIVVLEVQQSSDITYRLFDYNRPRELHIEEALKVTDVNLNAMNLANNPLVGCDGFSFKTFSENEFFTFEQIIVHKYWKTSSKPNKFTIVTCSQGTGLIEYQNHRCAITKGDSYLIPASLGNYTVLGSVELLVSTPN